MVDIYIEKRGWIVDSILWQFCPTLYIENSIEINQSIRVVTVHMEIGLVFLNIIYGLWKEIKQNIPTAEPIEEVHYYRPWSGDEMIDTYCESDNMHKIFYFYEHTGYIYDGIRNLKNGREAIGG